MDINFDEKTHHVANSQTDSTSALTINKNPPSEPTAHPWSKSSKLALELNYLSKQLETERKRREDLQLRVRAMQGSLRAKGAAGHISKNFIGNLRSEDPPLEAMNAGNYNLSYLTHLE